MKICLATGNKNKLAEFSKFISVNKTDIELLSASLFGGMPEVDEAGKTFDENAYLKAAALKKYLPEAISTLADDSGLEVDALHGKPGVRSARYAGDSANDSDNNKKLLDQLKEINPEMQNARFVCSLCLIDSNNQVYYFKGVCKGNIIDKPAGKNGFGYDPLFQPIGYTKTFAELGSDLKNKISHRAKALEELMKWILEFGK